MKALRAEVEAGKTLRSTLESKAEKWHQYAKHAAEKERKKGEDWAEKMKMRENEL